MPIGIRPGIGSTTLFHDRLLASLAQEMGARTLFSGRGGDALFFQHPTACVAADPWPGNWRGKASRFESIARWAQSPIWSVVAHALSPWHRESGGTRAANVFVRDKAPREEGWAGDLHGLSVAKQMQILAIAGDRSAFGPSWCSEGMRVIHPLLSQPLVEYALGQSVLVLTDGRRDRALARAAFARRLPPALVARRGKGSLSSFFGRTLAMSIPFLRDQLLGGTLMEAGILDRQILEPALERDYLMQHDCYTSLLALLLAEQWMRVWQERLRQPAAA